MRTPHPAPTIGVFDSGVGGLSVMRALHQALPQARLLYVADSAYAPYGERDDAFVQARSQLLTQHLLDHGAELIVIACNTATAAAIATLRQRFDHIPFVGLEPGIKPALQASRHKRIGVMATAGTLRSEKFRGLLGSLAHEAQFTLQACTGLAGAIEKGDLHAPEVLQLINTHTTPLIAAQCDTVVLGCTHYPFVQAHIQAALGPEVQLIETTEAITRRVAHLLKLSLPHHTPENRQLTLWTSEPPTKLQNLVMQWLGWPVTVQPL